MSGPATDPIDAATAAQRSAANPAVNAWTAANAGSGKTRVLIDRVVRLLLAGADPGSILCVTFTKAAAAEMEQRLFAVLGAWALKDDAGLSAAIMALDGRTTTVAADRLNEARRLFARALETPGGLKIQTLHAFSESILRRFPLEAGLAPGFDVASDEDAAALQDAALDDVARGQAGEAPREAFERLAALKDPQSLQGLVGAVVRAGPAIEEETAQLGGLNPYLEDIARRLDVDPDATEKSLSEDYKAATDVPRLAALIGALETGKKTDGDMATALRQAERAVTTEAFIDAMRDAFLTDREKQRSLGKLPTKDVKNAFPEAEGWLLGQQARFNQYCDRLSALASFRLTSDLHVLGAAVRERYRNAKALRALVDYDDLVLKAKTVFEGERTAWARYKLDQGLDHVLLDEAQDTSPAQWSVLDGIAAEFFAGLGAAEDQERHRTVFVVGDQKQSIYSFQGADAGLFDEKLSDYHARAETAEVAFEAPFMEVSFRTTPPILQFTDELFAEEEAASGLGERTSSHVSARVGGAGRVELWPLVKKPDAPEEKPWHAPVDAEARGDPNAILAEKIAATIAGWLENGERLASLDRPLRASDIMVLATRRGPVFHAVSRALAQKGVPVEGADRILLLDDAGVQDLLALARWALQRSDDLSLAELLRSPFGGVSEQALFEIAHGRDGPLHRIVREKAAGDPKLGTIADRLFALSAGANRLSPFDFFSHALDSGTPTGRTLLSKRLGTEWDEPVASLLRLALDYEAEPGPSLEGFLRWLRGRGGEVKRELDEGGGGVRVMTVHGAKGLEAEVVFLADANDAPQPPKSDAPYALLGAPETPGATPRRLAGALVVDAGETPRPQAIEAARDDALRRQMEERRRLLYVAATRARERLYICGTEGQRKDTADQPDVNRRTWHGLATRAFRRLVDRGLATAQDDEDGVLYRLEAEQTAAVKAQPEDAPTPAPPAPDWLDTPAPAELQAFALSPSALGADELPDADLRIDAPSRSPVATDPRRRGLAIHALLEHLPGLPPPERAPRADRYLAAEAADAPQSERDGWRDEALAVLDDARFAAVFAPGSLAEAPISGRLGNGDLLVSGQIDRLAVSETEILCVDYKTNRPPPARWEDAPDAYKAQLAAYAALLQKIFPGRPVRAALLWTYGPSLMEIPEAGLIESLNTALGDVHAPATRADEPELNA
ncbi:MAG: double-strand break repair helicase AddA [Pseudomonadota bacterium]